MKSIYLIFFLVFPLYISAQDAIVPFKDLKDVYGLILYKNSEFTGKTMKEVDGKSVIYTYKKGLLDGTIIEKNTITTYSNGIIKDYIYRDNNKNEIVHIENGNLAKKIVEIKFGIHFDDEINDTIFLKNTEAFYNDSTHFKVGVYIIYKNKKKDFIEVENIKMLSASYTFHAFTNQELPIKTSFLSNQYIKRSWKISPIYIDDIKFITRNNEIINAGYKKMLFKELK